MLGHFIEKIEKSSKSSLKQLLEVSMKLTINHGDYWEEYKKYNRNVDFEYQKAGETDVRNLLKSEQILEHFCTG
jgi:hypothetical protein